MKVYKFGGASVKDAAGIRNLASIVSKSDDQLVVVVSAMGKTTNQLERVLEHLWNKDVASAQAEWDSMIAYHQTVVRDLGLDYELPICQKVPQLVDPANYDLSYDQMVSQGELLSTHIVSAYLTSVGQNNQWLNMPDLLLTDATYRDANVDIEQSAMRFRKAVMTSSESILIVQGFIGGTAQGMRTTLGREGSDYTAALVGNFLDAESVTIWKDVPGILNADPRLVENTVLLPQLCYNEAVELAYSGAQIIHPKTIRPLENKSIPLYVKPFAEPEAPGSVIHAGAGKIQHVPVVIWRKNQMLITMRAKDFAFVLEDSLSEIFQIINQNRLRVSLIQSSAVTISVCVDNTRYVQQAIEQLSRDFTVTYNDHLELLTIRGTTPEMIAQLTTNREILLTQTTRRTARYVMKTF